MNELETRLARTIANTLAQLDGVPTEVEIEDGYAYVKRKGAEYRTRYVFPPEAYDDLPLFKDYGGPVFRERGATADPTAMSRASLRAPHRVNSPNCASRFPCSRASTTADPEPA